MYCHLLELCIFINFGQSPVTLIVYFVSNTKRQIHSITYSIAIEQLNININFGCFLFYRWYRRLRDGSGFARSIHAIAGSSMLGHPRTDFAETSSNSWYTEISTEKRFPDYAKTESRTRLRRTSKAHAGTQNLSYVPRLLCCDTRGQKTQTWFQ